MYYTQKFTQKLKARTSSFPACNRLNNRPSLIFIVQNLQVVAERHVISNRSDKRSSVEIRVKVPASARGECGPWLLSVGRSDRSVRRDIIEYIDGRDARPSNLEIRCWIGWPIRIFASDIRRVTDTRFQTQNVSRPVNLEYLPC